MGATEMLPSVVEPEPHVPEAYIEAVGRFMDRSVDPLRIDARSSIDDGVIEGLAALGAFGVSIPERDGGAGLGLRGACATVERIARRDRSVATTVGLHLGLGTRGLVAFGTDAQRARWLPRLASGELVSSFATTEPQAGSDLSRLGTTAEVMNSGRLRVRGQKIYVTNGGLADLYTITASTPSLGGAARGQSLVVLERDTPGLDVGAEEKKMGLRGSSTVPLYLDDVEVPLDHVIGTPGEGRTQLTHVLAWGRTIMASGCLGTARRAMELAFEHACTRRQFGAALCALPVVRRQLAELQATVFAMDALVAETAALDQDAEQLELLSLSTKVFCSEADWTVCDRALQLHGGSGFIEESEVPILLRDARITRIFEGANDVLLTRIGSAEYVNPRRADAAECESELDGIVWDARQQLFAQSGLRGLRDGVALHRLGRLVTLRDATRAAWNRAKGGDEAQHARAALWTGLALAQARASMVEATAAFDDLVVEAALGEVTP
jgi:alkylation response protein AidB-like acyl-CoA dehydrogenase